jgi:ABC-2 type transport system permease protein
MANKIKNKHGLIIILLTIVVALFFAAYMLLFDRMVQFLKDTEFSVFSPEVVRIIKTICKYLIPVKYLADMMILNELYIAYPVLIYLTALTFIATILVIVKLYQKTLLGNIEAEGSAFKKVTKNKVRPVFFSLMNKEFLEIFRSVNYSFQYFVLACAMPIMVFFCNRITLALAKNQVGEQITLGISLLVMLIFTTIICSFAATSISREGNNVYHIKIIPVSPLVQLAAKFTMYFIVSFLANVLSIAVIVFTKQMDVKHAFGVLGVVQACAVALTLFSMRRDIVKPYFNVSGEGELVENNVNTTMSVGIGLLIALVIGVGAMLLGYLVSVQVALYYGLGIAGGLLILSFLTYFIRLKHRFDYIDT